MSIIDKVTQINNYCVRTHVMLRVPIGVSLIIVLSIRLNKSVVGWAGHERNASGNLMLVGYVGVSSFGLG